jgi:hypothetical protein
MRKSGALFYSGAHEGAQLGAHVNITQLPVLNSFVSIKGHKGHININFFTRGVITPSANGYMHISNFYMRFRYDLGMCPQTRIVPPSKSQTNISQSLIDFLSIYCMCPRFFGGQP